MYEQLKETAYNYFVNNTENVDVDRLNALFEGIGYFKRSKNVHEKIRDCLWKVMHNNQLLYIRKLSEKFPDKIIFMKGILVSEELYGDIYQRRSSDIDILVKEEDVDEVGQYLMEEGFSYLNKCENWQEEVKKFHLEFLKPVSKKINVMIEVHGKAFNPPHFYEAFTDQIWKHAEYRDVLGMKPMVMDLYDRVIYYILHYCKHTMSSNKYMILTNPVDLRMMLDVYSTVKKYDFDFGVFISRAKELDVIWECSEVFQTVYTIFPDFCSEESMQQIRDAAFGKEKSVCPYLNRRMSLYEVIEKFFSRDYGNFLTQYIDYDFSNIINLNEKIKPLFSFKNEWIDSTCYGCVDEAEKVQITFEFEPIGKRNLEELQIFFFYHIHGSSSNEYLVQIVVHFEKEGEAYCCRFMDGIFNHEVAIDYHLDQREQRYWLKLMIPYEKLKDNLVTYNVLYNCINSWNICLTGNDWNDFKTMLHFRCCSS